MRFPLLCFSSMSLILHIDLQFQSQISVLAAAAFIGGALFVLQQFAGINGVLYFSSLTFNDVGITNGALASLYVGITNFAGLGYDMDMYITFFYQREKYNAG